MTSYSHLTGCVYAKKIECDYYTRDLCRSFIPRGKATVIENGLNASMRGGGGGGDVKIFSCFMYIDQNDIWIIFIV